MESLGIASVAAITVICYLIGNTLKWMNNFRDEWIPSAMGISGGILGVVAYYTKMPEFDGFHILTAIAVGIVSGLASTGINQVWKQSKKAGE